MDTQNPTTATPVVTLRNAQTPQQVKEAVMRLQFDECKGEQNSLVPCNLIWGNAEPLPAKTQQGIKNRFVISSQTVVDFPKFEAQINAFFAQPFATAEEARNGFYAIADKYTVRAVIWEDNPDLGVLKAYGKAQGLLRLSDPYTTKDGQVKQSWEITRVSSVAKAEQTVRRGFSMAQASAPVVGSVPTPSAVPTPQPVMAGAPSAPIMKRLTDGSVYTVEALLGANWPQAQIDALPNA